MRRCARSIRASSTAAFPASARTGLMPAALALTRSPRAWAGARRHRNQRHLGGIAAVLWDRTGIAQPRAQRRGAMGPHLVARGANLHARFPGGALSDEG